MKQDQEITIEDKTYIAKSLCRQYDCACEECAFRYKRAYCMKVKCIEYNIKEGNYNIWIIKK